MVRELPDADEVGISCDNLHLLLREKRSISNQIVEESIYKFDAQDEISLDSFSQKNFEWVPLKEIDRVTLSGPHRKWVQKIIADI